MTAVGGRRTASRKGADYYPTPAWATEALLIYEQFEGTIKEPCCGEGFMAEVLENAGYDVIASDKYDYGYGKVKNAFKIKRADNIITNPPFNLAEKLARKFVRVTDNKVALLLRLSFLESARRYAFFEEYAPTRIYIFTERVSMYPAKTAKSKKKKATGTVAYAWFVWEKGDMIAEPRVHWIKPGLKRQGLK